MPKTALVTGGAGFIGAHLCRELLGAGWSVRALDDLSTGRRDNLPADVDLVEGDVRDGGTATSACAGVDTVFHLAARVSIRQSVETFYEDAETNLMGTLNLLRGCGAAGVRRMVLASSMAVYAEGEPQGRVTEEHPTRPISPYGVAKLAAERYLHLVGPTLGVEPVVLRFFNTYGPGQGYTPYVGVLTIFATRILEGKKCLIYGDGQQRRDFTHVGDIVRGCVAAATAPGAAGQTINLGSGHGTTVTELAALVRGHFARGEFEHVARDATELMYSVADIGRARSVLGYEPQGRLSERIGEVVDAIAARLT